MTSEQVRTSGLGAGWPRPARLAVLGAALVALAVLAAAVYYAVRLLWFSPADQGYRAEALAAARQAATDFSTYDYRRVEADFARLHERATGDFQEEVEEAQEALVPLLKEGKATARGQVRDAAIIAAGPEQVNVMAVVDEFVTNESIPDGKEQRYRFLMVMTRVDGRWLVSDLQQA